MGVLDEYSGELPFAFIVLKAEAARRANASASEAAKIRAAIAKVRQKCIHSLIVAGGLRCSSCHFFFYF